MEPGYPIGNANMKKVSLCRSAILAGASLFVFCGSNYPLLGPAESSKTAQLREYCSERNLTNETVQTADALVDRADSLEKAGMNEESYWSDYRAVILYRTALAGADLEQTRATIATLEKELLQTRQQLKTYQEVLNELEKTRAP